MKSRKITKVEGGFVLTTYQSAVPGKYKKYEKFIPKKTDDAIEGQDYGWSFKTRNSWMSKWHYFRKGDTISLCGTIRLVAKKGHRFSKPEGFRHRNKCKQCHKILKSYTDLNNFSRSYDLRLHRGNGKLKPQHTCGTELITMRFIEYDKKSGGSKYRIRMNADGKSECMWCPDCKRPVMVEVVHA